MHSQTVETPRPVFDAHAPTRASLLRRVCDWRDDASWQEFFQTYWKLIYSLALRAGLTECEAEEVVQATMISVARKIRQYEPRAQSGMFRQWICRHAQWKIADRLRERRREQKHRRPPSPDAERTRTDTVARIPDDRNELANFVQDDWNHAIAQVALGRVKRMVKPKHYQIYDLHVIKNWPIREVARLLQVNVAQVYLIKSRISRLLKRETKELEAQSERLPAEPKIPATS